LKHLSDYFARSAERTGKQTQQISPTIEKHSRVKIAELTDDSLNSCGQKEI
jgi:hypothetical protein